MGPIAPPIRDGVSMTAFVSSVVLGMVLIMRGWGGLSVIALAALPVRMPAPWGSVTPFELLLVPALLIELVHAGKAHRRFVVPPKVVVPVLLVMAWGLASGFWAVSAPMWIERLAVFAQSGLAGWAVYLAALRLGWTKAIRTIALVATLSAGWSLVWFYILDGAVALNLQPANTVADAVSQGLRLGSPLVGPSNYYASFILLSLPLTILAARERKAYWLGVLLQTYCIGATASRGAAVALVGLLIWTVTTYYLRRRRLPHPMWVVVAGVAVVAAWVPFMGLLRQVMVQRQLSASGEGLAIRAELWSAAVRLWSEHFWLGVGFGNWQAYVGLSEGTGAHNFLLHFGAELGVVGASLMVWALLAHFAVLVEVPDPLVRALCEAVIVAGVVNGTVQASFEGVVYSWTLGITLGALLACAVGMREPLDLRKRRVGYVVTAVDR
jgi:O-antigen ligase